MIKKFYLESYGCQMNVYDSELVRSVLTDAGYEESSTIEDSHILLLNTCAIRENATKRVINKMNQYRNYYKNGITEICGILGCMPQHNSEGIKEQLPYINFQMGPDSYKKLPNVLDLIFGGQKYVEMTELDNMENYEEVFPMRNDGTNAYISIIRGCNNFCTYCVVPYTRGRERSRDVDSIIEETKKAVEEGFSEITLLGQNVNSYSYDGLSFPQLLKKVSEVEGVKRLRFATSHPKDLSDELIEVMAETENICNNFHLPFQAGSNDILKKMNRNYTVEHYLEKINKIKSAIPEISLTTDIIVGFPTETEEDFEKTLDVLREVKFDNAFTFIYSMRKNTAAETRFPDDIPYEIKQNRLSRLLDVQKDIGIEMLKDDIGKVKEVLIESVSKKSDTQLKGRTEQNRIVIFDKVEGAEVGSYVNVEITGAGGVTLFGKIIK